MSDDRVEFARRFYDGLKLSYYVDPPPPQGALDGAWGEVYERLRWAATTPNLDTNDFDVLVSMAAEFLLDEEWRPKFPKWLAPFAADVLLGKRKRPTKRGPDKNAKFERDFKLYQTTKEVAKTFGLQLYTNNELSGRTTAAEIVGLAVGCSTDVVVAVFKKMLLHLGEK